MRVKGARFHRTATGWGDLYRSRPPDDLPIPVALWMGDHYLGIGVCYLKPIVALFHVCAQICEGKLAIKRVADVLKEAEKVQRRESTAKVRLASRFGTKLVQCSLGGQNEDRICVG